MKLQGFQATLGLFLSEKSRKRKALNIESYFGTSTMKKKMVFCYSKPLS